jgi:hypothetical protein
MACKPAPYLKQYYVRREKKALRRAYDRKVFICRENKPLT